MKARRWSALTEIGSEQNSTMVFLLPIDMLRLLATGPSKTPQT